MAFFCSSPRALAFVFSSPFPRVVYQALSFLCVLLSVRGYSTPHAFLERRRVKRLSSMHASTASTEMSECEVCSIFRLHSELTHLPFSNDEAYWRCLKPLEFKHGIRNCVSVCLYVCVVQVRRLWFTESQCLCWTAHPVISHPSPLACWFHLRSVWVSGETLS